MPGLTPNLSIPYPLWGEVIDAIQIQDLATAVDSWLNSNFITGTSQTLTLSNGWASVGAAPLRVTRFGKLVVIEGEIYKETGSVSGHNTVGTMPGTFRPAVRWATVCSRTGSETAFFRLMPTGEITIFGAANSATPGFNINGIYRLP